MNTLTSLCLYEINDQDMRLVLQLLEKNNTVTNVCLLRDLQSITDENTSAISNATASQLNETLKRNTCLKRLRLNGDPVVLRLLALFMKSNKLSSLEHVCLDTLGDVSVSDHNMDGLPIFLWSLKTNTTLSSLKLQYAYREDLITRQTWKLLLQVVRENVHIKKIFLNFPDPDDEAPIYVDEFASALCDNQSLTAVEVLHNGRTQPMFDFCCRLFERRNRIREMVERKQVSDALWPHILRSLAFNPSAVFMTARYIPWPCSQTPF